MRRFRFRLEPLLRLRAQIERSKKRELATAMAEVNTIDQRLAAATQGLRDCADQAGSMGAVGKLARALETGLRRHQWRLSTDLAKAQQKADAVRTEYVAKVRDVRTLQKLKDSKRDAWRVAAAKAEQAELDELARLGRAAVRDSEQGGGKQR